MTHSHLHPIAVTRDRASCRRPARRARLGSIVMLLVAIALSSCTLPSAGADPELDHARQRLVDGLLVDRVELDDHGRYVVIGTTATDRSALFADLGLIIEGRVDMVGLDREPSTDANTLWGRFVGESANAIELRVAQEERGSEFVLRLAPAVAARLFRLEGDHLTVDGVSAEEAATAAEAAELTARSTDADSAGGASTPEGSSGVGTGEHTEPPDDYPDPGNTQGEPADPSDQTPATAATENSQHGNTETQPTTTPGVGNRGTVADSAPPTTTQTTAPTSVVVTAPPNTTTSTTTSTTPTPEPIKNLTHAVQIVQQGLAASDPQHLGAVTVWTGSYTDASENVLNALDYIAREWFPVQHSWMGPSGRPVVGAGIDRDPARADLLFSDLGATWRLELRNNEWDILVTGNGPIPVRDIPSSSEIEEMLTTIDEAMDYASIAEQPNGETLYGRWTNEQANAQSGFRLVLTGVSAGVELRDEGNVHLIGHDGTDDLIRVDFYEGNEIRITVYDAELKWLFG